MGQADQITRVNTDFLAIFGIIHTCKVSLAVNNFRSSSSSFLKCFTTFSAPQQSIKAPNEADKQGTRHNLTVYNRFTKQPLDQIMNDLVYTSNITSLTKCH